MVLYCVRPALQSQLSPSSSLHVALEVPALDVSLVDGRPQELVLLSMDGLVAEYHAGNSAGTAYTQVSPTVLLPPGSVVIGPHGSERSVVNNGTAFEDLLLHETDFQQDGGV